VRVYTVRENMTVRIQSTGDVYYLLPDKDSNGRYTKLAPVGDDPQQLTAAWQLGPVTITSVLRPRQAIGKDLEGHRAG